MGMRCMTIFLKEKNMPKPHKLRDAKLVIDGYALLYYAKKLFYDDIQPGKENVCEEYFDYLKQMLTDFVECQIQCYVIFDGGENDVTIQKEMNRFDKQLIELETAMSKNQDITQFINSYFLNAMIHILNELGILHATCRTYEADDIISALAKHLGCPILSNDTDFFLSAAPLIPIWSCTRERGADFISCEILSREEFLQVYRLKEEVLPIILSCSFKQNFFDMFFRNCGISTHVFIRISGLLDWLSTRTFKSALKVVLKYLRPIDQQKCLDYIQSSRNITTGSQTENCVFKYMTNPPSATIDENDPAWFSKGIVSGRINVSYINMCMRNLYLCHPEKMFLPSLRILRYAFDLLTRFSTSWFVYMGQRDSIDGQIQSLDITTSYSINAPQLHSDRGPLYVSGWDHLPDYFGHFVRETLPGLPESVLNEVPADCRLWLIALVWWKIHAGAKLQTATVTHCLILCRIRGALLAPERGARLGIDELRREQAMEALKIMKQKGVNISREQQKAEDVRPMLNHCVEFLHILDQLNCLNALCAGPYDNVRLYESYNYSFLYAALALGLSSSGALHVAPESVFEAGEARELYKKLMEAFDRCVEAVGAANTQSTPDKTVKTPRVARCDFNPF